MQTCEFAGMELSRLGFGAMRLPLNEDKTIDEQLTQQMVDYAIEHGINYFDTAYPYHSGMSEIVLARCLKKHPEGSYHLATKYPGHQIGDSYDPADTFADQLRKCGVDHFDFYMLHNVYSNSMKTYMDPRWGIVDYFVEQRRLGTIKHLGFSCHARLDELKTFLDYCGDQMEFCQIQLNYLDWTLENAKAKCELLEQHGIDIWVMEPLHGGKLAQLTPENQARLDALRPDESAAAWALRWVANRNVKVILSGMSDMQQMIDNVRTFEGGRPLDQDEEQLLLDIAETMKNTVPCTSCRYCCDSCPLQLDIPLLLDLYNAMNSAISFTPAMAVEAMEPDKRPSACIGCGACASMCPQEIEIPKHLKAFDEMLAKMPSWAESSRQREEDARRIREAGLKA